jgi:hypothetical protein
MELVRVLGVIDRIDSGIAAIVLDNGEHEIYVRVKQLKNAREGKRVDILVDPALDPNAVSKVITSKAQAKKAASALPSFAGLIRAFLKNIEILRSRERLLERAEEPDEEALMSLQEKIAYLEKGLKLFRQ